MNNIFSHDAIFKRFLTDPEIAKDFLEAHLPEEVKALSQLETLQLEHGSFVEPDLRQQYVDMLYSLKIADHDSYIYVLIEHQSTPSVLMPFRMLRYQISIMQRHLEKHKKNKVPIVIPLLFYTGQRTPYPYSIELMDCFEHPELAKKYLFQSLHLIDITSMSNEDIHQHKKAALLEMVQKHIFTQDMLDLADKMAKTLNEQFNRISQELFKDMLEYVLVNHDSEHVEQFLRIINNQSHFYEGTIMNMAERLKLQGWNEGLEQGLEKGVEQGLEQGEKIKALEIAKKMCREGLDKKLIQKIIGLSETEFKQLI